MSEKIKHGEKISKSRRAFLADSAKAGIDLAKGVLLGYGAVSTMSRSPGDSREKAKILPKIPNGPEARLNAVGLGIWMSNAARQFLDGNKNQIGFSEENGTLTITGIGDANNILIKSSDELKKVKEIRVVMSNFYESTIVFYFLNEDEKGGTWLTIHKQDNGKLEVRESKF